MRLCGRRQYYSILTVPTPASTSTFSASSSVGAETKRGADYTFDATTSRRRVPVQLEPVLPTVGCSARSHSTHKTDTHACLAHQKRNERGRSVKTIERLDRYTKRVKSASERKMAKSFEMQINGKEKKRKKKSTRVGNRNVAGKIWISFPVFVQRWTKISKMVEEFLRNVSSNERENEELVREK